MFLECLLCAKHRAVCRVCQGRIPRSRRSWAGRGWGCFAVSRVLDPVHRWMLLPSFPCTTRDSQRRHVRFKSQAPSRSTLELPCPYKDEKCLQNILSQSTFRNPLHFTNESPFLSRIIIVNRPLILPIAISNIQGTN